VTATADHLLTVECPYCGAAPYEPCRNMRAPSQATYGTGNATVAYPSHVPTTRPHPERRHAFLRAAAEAEAEP